MNPFQSLLENGVGDQELEDLFMEKVHEEKLWLLRQPVVIPGMFQKRLQKLQRLYTDYLLASKTLINELKNSDYKISNNDYKDIEFDQFLAEFDLRMNAFRLTFMNASEIEAVLSALQDMIQLEEAYYDALGRRLSFDEVTDAQVPGGEKLPAYRLREHLRLDDFAKNPEVLKEYARVKKILRVYRK